MLYIDSFLTLDEIAVRKAVSLGGDSTPRPASPAVSPTPSKGNSRTLFQPRSTVVSKSLCVKSLPCFATGFPAGDASKI